MVGLSISFCVLCWLLLIKLVIQPATHSSVVQYNAVRTQNTNTVIQRRMQLPVLFYSFFVHDFVVVDLFIYFYCICNSIFITPLTVFYLHLYMHVCVLVFFFFFVHLLRHFPNALLAILHCQSQSFKCLEQTAARDQLISNVI